MLVDMLAVPWAASMVVYLDESMVDLMVDHSVSL